MFLSAIGGPKMELQVYLRLIMPYESVDTDSERVRTTVVNRSPSSSNTSYCTWQYLLVFVSSLCCDQATNGHSFVSA